MNNKELFENIERDRKAKKLQEIPPEERTLKTLKDLQKPENYGAVDGDELKTEAVKWVKALSEWNIRNIGRPGLRFAKEAQIAILYGFFDLTDEDLK